MASETNSPFWRGFGNVLVLSPHHGKQRDLKFIYHGRDLANTTCSESMSHDWNLVAAYLASAIQGERLKDESESE
jgi:hypothetical protein